VSHQSAKSILVLVMIMKVTVKFFSHFRQMVGTDQLSVDLDGGVTIASLLNSLSERFDNPALKNDRAVLLVNQKNAFPETILKDGDSVLLLPILGGG
jgi:MoaD family protein